MFSEFGPIKLCKVMRDFQGHSIGIGFVEFFTPADATRAVNAMNGKVIAGNPLSVSLVEPKDENNTSPDDHSQWTKLRSLACSGTMVYFRGFAPSVTADELHYLFGSAGGEVLHVALHNHPYAGYGVVMYSNFEQAKIAVESFDYYVYKEKLIRVHCPALDSIREIDECTEVMIEYVKLSIDEECLRDLCNRFGTVISCKLHSGNSTRNGCRYGVVEFEKKGAAGEMIRTLNRAYIDSQLVEIIPFSLSKRGEEDEDERERLRRTVVVSNLSESVYQLENYFRQFGYITDVDIESDEVGRSKGVGSVSFRKVEDADLAVKKMDGHKHDNKIWSVKKAPIKFEQEKGRKFEHLQDGYIQVDNLHGFVSDESLRKMFSEFGPIKLCKVLRDSQGQSIGTGFVEFSSPADATRAVNAMNRKVIIRKTLSVALLELKSNVFFNTPVGI